MCDIKTASRIYSKLRCFFDKFPVAISGVKMDVRSQKMVI